MKNTLLANLTGDRWLALSMPDLCVQVLTPSPQNVICFGDGVIHYTVKMRSSRWVLIRYDWVPCKQEIYLFLFLKILFIYFLERGGEGEREGQKHQCVAASHVPPTGDLARNPGMCPRLGTEPVTL